jgi:molybdenum cofactor guanylyltransferase
VVEDLGSITGLVLAGGKGSRFNGLDKGLQLLHGKPLVSHVLARLTPQVDTLMISANRHLPFYQHYGWPVYADEAHSSIPFQAQFQGPLAGVNMGLKHCPGRYLLTAPCDAPQLPHDLSLRLYSALQSQPHANMAMAATQNEHSVQPHPTFCLMRVTPSLRADLKAFLASGQRKVAAWIAQQACVIVVFENSSAFFNINTPAQLNAG